MKRSIPLRTLELEFLKDPKVAREYLKVSLEETRKDGDRAAFLRALRNVVDARGGVVDLAERIHKPTSTLYQAISEEGNPRLDTLDTILNDIGLQLSVDVVEDRSL
jgi:DNA-binding phage protein